MSTLMSSYPQAGLQFQPLRMNTDAIGALAPDTAIALNTTLSTSVTQSFLVKQLQYAFLAHGGSAGQGVIIGVANGTATVAEIASGIRDAVVDPDDATANTLTASHHSIWWETLRMVSLGNFAEGNFYNETISIGGGKGIPWKEDTGVQIFAYNPASGALTTGGVIDGIICFKGVWLRD